MRLEIECLNCDKEQMAHTEERSILPGSEDTTDVVVCDVCDEQICDYGEVA